MCRMITKNLPDIVRTLNIEALDGLLIDMGVSSIQLDQAEGIFVSPRGHVGYAHESGGRLQRI